MEFDVIAPVGSGLTADPDWMVGLAQHVESCGFGSLVVVEHAVMFAEYASTYPYDASGRVELAADCPVPDPLELLAFIAGSTSTLGLATGVLVLPDHNPVVLAKRIATLDALSGGRFRLCVGMGWMREEVEACGADFDTRGRRADEQIQVMRALWSGDPTSYEGEFFRFEHAVCRPAPGERSIPIHIGGHSKAAARRAGRLGDGLQPLGVAGEDLQALRAEMARAAEDAGRDPAKLELNLGHLVTRIDQGKAERLAEVGATRVVLAMSDAADLDQAKDELSACAERLGF
ncbi:LLM class F420-dependent oxidoreductase [Nocardioides marmorisolisilvae]|uniref:LLM class F420-dependent oxidoreductase n=1 Tax=Nocardioides marmorisolisilvae TaxID=1542737 RepID=A0A3N0DVH2_9ACTN|nr:LLM class F420-dependent oxidoreductase [Nocardioides marmorisolisilvae]RNL79622.1 LLM class F420-dependent oxidoreductase [Nocardioides marmorisolisilvae]